MKTIKRHVLVITFTLVGTFSFAQTEKGSFIAGGNFGFSSEKNKVTLGNLISEREIISINFNPQASYFIIDNLALGLSLPINYSKIEQSQDLVNETTSFLIGPTARYYFNFNKFSLFPELSYSVGRQKSEGLMFLPSTGNIESVSTEANLNRFSAGMGLALFLNKNVAIEGILAYKTDDTDVKEDPGVSSSSSKLAFNVGLQFYF